MSGGSEKALEGVCLGEAGLKHQMSLEQEEILFEKRKLERADELKQIDSLGKVETLKDRLDRKLGRNLALKLSIGPLGKKNRRLSQSHSMKKKRGRLGRGGRSRKVSADGETSDYLIGQNAVPLKSNAWDQQQEKELKELEELSIVRKQSNHAMLKNHVARMCNHRLTIRPTSMTSKGGKGKRKMDSRKKSSVLVTSMEDSEEVVRELHRQQSRVLIESMIQFPSRQQRVLQKLSSEQQKKISVVEEAKASRRKRLSSPPHLSSPPVPVAAMPMTSPIRPLSGTIPLSEVSQDMSQDLVKYSCGTSIDYLEDKMIEQTDNDEIGDFVSDDITDALMGVARDKPSVGVARSSDGDTTVTSTSNKAPEDVSSTPASDDDDVDMGVLAIHSDITGEHTTISPHSLSSPLDSLHPSSISHLSPVPSPLHLPAQEEEKPVHVSCDYELADEEDALSWADSSTESSQASLEKATPPHLSYSSPQFPLGMSSHTSSLMSALGGCVSMTRGTYGTVEVEVDPFAREFQLGPRPEDRDMRAPSFFAVNKSSRHTSASRSPQASISGQLSDTLFSPIPLTIESGKRCIPSKAFQDQDFLLYVKQLGYEPEVSDYITYRMRVIGDNIEKRYSKELNQAMDDMFYEVLKQNLSWSTFSSVSRKLLVGGSRIQDSILLVPCFARRLMDVVPHLGSTIGQFTEKILDNYASDSILGMGGWSSFMESYEEEERIGSAVDLVPYVHPHPAACPSLSPSGTGSYATLPIRRKLPNPQPHSFDLPDMATTSPPPSVTQSLRQQPQPLVNFGLRRCNSVEVLFAEEEEVEEESNHHVSDCPLAPHFHVPILTRSASTSSLDLATPTPGPSNRARALTYIHNNTTVATDSSPVISGMPMLSSKGFGLPSLPEESRVYSRRSSACSSIIMIDHTHFELEVDVTDGFEVIGRDSNMDGTPEKEQSSKNPDSDSGQTGNSCTPLSVEGESTTEDNRTPFGEQARRRRRSSADIAAPLAVATAHLIVAAVYLFGKQ